MYILFIMKIILLWCIIYSYICTHVFTSTIVCTNLLYVNYTKYAKYMARIMMIM